MARKNCSLVLRWIASTSLVTLQQATTKTIKHFNETITIIINYSIVYLSKYSYFVPTEIALHCRTAFGTSDCLHRLISNHLFLHAVKKVTRKIDKKKTRPCPERQTTNDRLSDRMIIWFLTIWNIFHSAYLFFVHPFLPLKILSLYHVFVFSFWSRPIFVVGNRYRVRNSPIDDLLHFVFCVCTCMRVCVCAWIPHANDSQFAKMYAQNIFANVISSNIGF